MKFFFFLLKISLFLWKFFIFPLKIFVSSKIFEESAIFEALKILGQRKKKFCTFLKTLNFNFPHIILSSTAGKSCSSCCLKENFYQRKFFIFLWKSSYLRRSSKNLQSSKIFEEILNWRRFFVFVFGLFSETEESSYSSSVHFQSSLQHWKMTDYELHSDQLKDGSDMPCRKTQKTSFHRL